MRRGFFRNARISGGYLAIGAWQGAPIRLHWTAPLGALVFSNFGFLPGLWLGFVIIILVHEIGHAMLVHRFDLDVEEITITGIGGHCAYSGWPTELEATVIAWGGVLAQLALLVFVIVVVRFLPFVAAGPMGQLMFALTGINLAIAMFNLIPVRPFDGAQAWRIVPLLARRLTTHSRRFR